MDCLQWRMETALLAWSLSVNARGISQRANVSWVYAGINFTDMRLDRLLQMLLNPSEQMTELRQSLAAASANRANAQVCAALSCMTEDD